MSHLFILWNFFAFVKCECIFTKYLKKLVESEDIKDTCDEINKDEPITAADLFCTIYSNMIFTIIPPHTRTPLHEQILPSTSTKSLIQQDILVALHDISSKL